MWAAAGWGASIALAGATDYLYVVLFFLAAAGASDMVSVLFRHAIWNQTIPDHLRGRLAGIELLSYTVGPLVGQLQGGIDGRCYYVDYFGNFGRYCLRDFRRNSGNFLAQIAEI